MFILSRSVDIDREQHILVVKCCSIYIIQIKFCLFIDILNFNGFDNFARAFYGGVRKTVICLVR